MHTILTKVCMCVHVSRFFRRFGLKLDNFRGVRIINTLIIIIFYFRHIDISAAADSDGGIDTV